MVNPDPAKMRRWRDMAHLSVGVGAALLKRAQHKYRQSDDPINREQLLADSWLQAKTAVREQLEATFQFHAFVDDLSAYVAFDNEIPTWIIDPIDGQNNFARGVPEFSISAVCMVRGETLIAIMIQPMSGYVFTAIAGQGTWVNEQHIRIPSRDQLDGAHMGVLLGERDATPALGLQTQLVFSAAASGATIYMPGSSSALYGYLVSGAYDACWGMLPNPQAGHVLAGELLVREAGGVVCRSGDDDLSNGPTLLACHPDLLNLLQTHLADAQVITHCAN